MSKAWLKERPSARITAEVGSEPELGERPCHLAAKRKKETGRQLATVALIDGHLMADAVRLETVPSTMAPEAPFNDVPPTWAGRCQTQPAFCSALESVNFDGLLTRSSVATSIS
jgi:hypothetical protein